MQWTLRKFAVVDDRGTILRFQDDEKADRGERILPVVADSDPKLGEFEELWGPEYEVLPDRVRAYCKVMPMDREKVLDLKIAKLETATKGR